MPNPRNRMTGGQWDRCDICGLLFPEGELIMKKGVQVCTRTCSDNLQIERREQEISRILDSGVDQEGADLRYINRSFFSTQEEENFG